MQWTYVSGSRKATKHLLHYVLNILEIHAELRRMLERIIFWPSILIPAFRIERIYYSCSHLLREGSGKTFKDVGNHILR